MLGPEMRSTGEVMGLDEDLGIAYAKAQMAAKPALPTRGNAFLSVKNADKPRALLLARELATLDFEIYSTSGTADYLAAHNIKVHRLNKIDEGRPNAIDMIKNGQLHLIINTPSGMIPRQDENKIRAAAVMNSVCIMTSLTGALAAVDGIRALKDKQLTIRPIQSYIDNIILI
jgi:carbamoyl-phosphate synthase large subunit